MLMLEKGKIGNLELKNRIIFAPMGNHMDGDDSIAYYVARAKGGVGMLYTDGYPAFPEVEMWHFDEDVQLNHQIKMIEQIHAYDAKVCLQIPFGIGRVMRFLYKQENNPKPCVSASAVPEFGYEDKICRELTTEEVKEQLLRVRKAAKFIMKTGADAVLISSYGGYLGDQFLTSRWNKRTDEFGGDLKGRANLLLQSIAIIKKECGQDFPLIVKYSPYHYMEGEGYRTIEEGIALAKLFQDAGVDMLHLDSGCYEAWEKMMPSIYQQEQPLDLYVAELIKKAVDIPVAVNGKLGYPERGEAAIRQGKTDYLVVGRTLLADPEIPNKLAEGRPEDIKPCIGCNEGCIRGVLDGNPIRCAVNASNGAELRYELPKADRAKKVLIVGGGPAGLSAAIDAKTVGHSVELWEKSTRLGGLLNAAGRPSFKKEIADLVNYYRLQILKMGIKVRYCKEATAEDILAESFDEVIIATGGKPIIPHSIPGIDGSNVVTAIESLNDVATLGKNLVIVGAGLVGCETAVHLTSFGKKIDIIEMQKDILQENIFYQNKKMLSDIIRSNSNITIHTGTKLISIEKDFIKAEKNEKEFCLSCDTVVLAMGLKSNNELFTKLDGRIPVVNIGDSIRPRRVLEATEEARKAVLSISGISVENA